MMRVTRMARRVKIWRDDDELRAAVRGKRRQEARC